MSAIPITRPEIQTSPRLRVVEGVRPSTIRQVLNWTLASTVICLATFGTSSLAGHVMVEKARRDGITAAKRLRAATAAQAVLTRQIENLSNDKEMNQWAIRNGFVAPELAPHSSGSQRVLVAQR